VASEALNALCEFAQGRVGAVVAETDRDNIASQRVLEKCGFHPDGGDHDLLRWRRELPE
jgi:RimJ/RimL family protein N-acetyltransferase